MKNICAIPGMPEFIGPPLATWKFNECSLGIDRDTRASTGGENWKWKKLYRIDFDYEIENLYAPERIAGGAMHVNIDGSNEQNIFPALGWRE